MKDLMFKIRKNPELYIGAVIAAVISFILIAGFAFSPYDPNAMNAADKFAAPSASHLLGCDNFGRDLFCRLAVGGVTTLFIAPCASPDLEFQSLQGLCRLA